VSDEQQSPDPVMKWSAIILMMVGLLLPVFVPVYLRFTPYVMLVIITVACLCTILGWVLGLPIGLGITRTIPAKRDNLWTRFGVVLVVVSLCLFCWWALFVSTGFEKSKSDTPLFRKPAQEADQTRD
jgi:ABC-type phosphate/phosphonate transport system permease subunit